MFTKPGMVYFDGVNVGEYSMHGSKWKCTYVVIYNDFAHIPWEDTPNFPKPPTKKQIPKHKLLVKRPGYLPGVCGWDLRLFTSSLRLFFSPQRGRCFFLFTEGHLAGTMTSRPRKSRCDRRRNPWIPMATWRIIPFSKWLITMVNKSPKWDCSPSKWPKWLINGGY